MKKSLLLIAAGLITAASFQSCKTGGSDAVNLKMNLQPGSKYAYVMDMKTNMEQSAMGQTMKTENNVLMESTYEVATGEGSDKKLIISYDRIAMSLKNPMMNMEYDSKEGGKKDSMLNAMSLILNKPFTITISEKGEIKKIEGIDNIINSIGNTGTQEDEMLRRQVASTLNDSVIRSMMRQSLDIYPDKAVKIGDTWTKTMPITMGPVPIKMDNTYKLISITGDTAHLNINSKISSNGTSIQQGGQEIKVDLNGDAKGTIDVEVATGLVIDSKIKQSIKGEMSAMAMKMPMSVTIDTHVTGKKK